MKGGHGTPRPTICQFVRLSVWATLVNKYAQACDLDCGRRPGCASGGRARSAPALRRSLQSDLRRFRPFSAGSDPPAQTAQRTHRAVPRGSTHARHDGRRVPRKGHRTLSPGQTRAAHRVCRYRRCNPRDQQCAHRSLPDETVGPARGASLWCGRRHAR